jgi:hypothetical protein
MDKRAVYLVGHLTNQNIEERLRQLLPEAAIKLLPYPRASIAGKTVVVVFNDYVGVGKEHLLMKCLRFKPSLIMGLNKEGELVSLSESHIRKLWGRLIIRQLFFPIRVFYICMAIFYSQVYRLFYRTQPWIKIQGEAK